MKRSLPSFLVAAALSLLLCQCDDHLGSVKIASLRQQIEQIEAQSLRATKETAKVQEQLDQMNAERTKLLEDKAQADAAREDSEKRLKQLQLEFDAFKKSHPISKVTPRADDRAAKAQTKLKQMRTDLASAEQSLGAASAAVKAGKATDGKWERVSAMLQLAVTQFKKQISQTEQHLNELRHEAASNLAGK